MRHKFPRVPPVDDEGAEGVRSHLRVSVLALHRAALYVYPRRGEGGEEGGRVDREARVEIPGGTMLLRRKPARAEWCEKGPVTGQSFLARSSHRRRHDILFIVRISMPNFSVVVNKKIVYLSLRNLLG